MSTSPLIAHLTSVHPRDDVRVFVKMCCSVAAAGWRVALVVADGKGRATRSGVEIFDVGAPRSRFERILRVPARLAACARQLDADCYHLHDPELMPIGLRLRSEGKVVVFDSHEDTPEHVRLKTYLNVHLRNSLSKALMLYERYACRRMSGVIAATDSILSKFAALNPSTIMVANYPRCDELGSLVRKNSVPASVCYVGGVSIERGVQEMCGAIAATRSRVRLHLCGSFPSADLFARVQRLAGWQQVDYHGRVSREGIQRVMEASVAGLVLLHPTSAYMKSLPIKMFEYMCAGLPVVASDFPTWRQIIQEHRCGVLVDPMDVTAIAQALDFLVHNPIEAQQMGERGRRAVAERFNWESEIPKLMGFYESLMTAQSTLPHGRSRCR